MEFALAVAFWSFATAVLWLAADRRARAAVGGRAVRAVVRGLFAVFFGAMLAYLAVPASRLVVESEPRWVPPVLVTAAHLWHPGVLMMTVGVVAAGWAWRRLRRRGAHLATTAGALTPSPGDRGEGGGGGLTGDVLSLPPTSPATLSRRRALGLAACAVPPLLTTGLTAAAMAQRGGFRVRRLDVVVPSLPPDLDGLTVAHLTDLHVGNFFPPDAVARVADVVDALRPEVVVFTGDLVDRGLMDRLPLGFVLIDRLRKYPFAMVEGNHDLFGDASMFESIVRTQAKAPLLLDEGRTLAIPGRRTPVQLLGIVWGDLRRASEVSLFGDAAKMVRDHSEEATAEAVARVAKLRDPSAFPVLLAHHPHAFDAAAELNLPLVLSGHTHGGQIMLTDGIGAGPVRFRYWAGVHERNGSKLVISNGLGSWFPLRVNAPAEVLHLTLRAAAPAIG